MTSPVTISCLDLPAMDHNLPGLTDLLHSCVLAGASVNFIMPFTPDAAREFWISKVRPGVADGDIILMVASLGETLAGTVQLQCNTPPNQPHRADVGKLLVAPQYQRRGIARALMLELELQSASRNRSLITLDTRTGDKAEKLYVSLGYQTVGIIPGFSKDPFADHLDSTTLMFKQLH